MVRVDGNLSSVKVAFSQNSMLIFGSAFRVGSCKGVGRFTAAMLSNAEAMITCVEWSDEGEALVLCRAG